MQNFLLKRAQNRSNATEKAQKQGQSRVWWLASCAWCNFYGTITRAMLRDDACDFSRSCTLLLPFSPKFSPRPISSQIRKTRIYILLLFASLLFWDTNGNTIHIKVLPLLEDIDEISRYSWGAPTLAWLYRNLCRCVKKDAHTFTGWWV